MLMGGCIQHAALQYRREHTHACTHTECRSLRTWWARKIQSCSPGAPWGGPGAGPGLAPVETGFVAHALVVLYSTSTAARHAKLLPVHPHHAQGQMSAGCTRGHQRTCHSYRSRVMPNCLPCTHTTPRGSWELAARAATSAPATRTGRAPCQTAPCTLAPRPGAGSPPAGKTVRMGRDVRVCENVCMCEGGGAGV